MSSRSDLLTSIVTAIQDYRAGELATPTPEHVDRWARQFDKGVQVDLLAELNYVLAKTYFSRKAVTEFFSKQITHKGIAGDSPCSFWKRANFLDIQQRGTSQRDILALFSESLEAQCGTKVSKCGSADGPFFYLDDVLFTGTRVGTDLKAWIQNDAPNEAVVHILMIGAYRLGEWQCVRGLEAAAKEAGKKVTIHSWALTRLENRKKFNASAEVLWPTAVPSHEALAKYISEENKFPFQPRTPNGSSANKIFGSPAGRDLLERELLMAGVRIRAGCKNPKKVMRPLGFGHFGLGFGSTIITYRNCPNNCPLALWWGDPEATSGAFHWYPLVPRKTHEQSANAFDFGIEQ